MLCRTCGREIMQGAGFCPYCGEKIVQEETGMDKPVYQADVKRVLTSGKLVVYRDRTEFVTSSVQKATFSYDNLIAVKKEWDHIDFITGDGRKESCPADRKCVHEAFLYIEQMARPYLTRQKDHLLTQGIRYSFPSNQGMLNDGVLNLSAEQAEFKDKSGKSEIIPFQDVKSVSAFTGTLDFLMFDRQTKSFAVSKELRDEVIAFLTDSIAPYLARRKEDLMTRGIYFSFFGSGGGTVDFFADRVEYRDRLGQVETVFFEDVRTASMYIEMLELALTDGTSKSFSIDADEANEVLQFVKSAIEPYVRARTEGFDIAFGLDERIEFNEERGIFHIIRQNGREISDELPLDSLTECQWEERKDLNSLGSVVSGGIALFKSAARVAGNQTVAEVEERLSCVGVTAKLHTNQRTWTESIWFGLFPTGMSRTNKKYDRYLTEWKEFSAYLREHCPDCEQIGPVSSVPEVQCLEYVNNVQEVPQTVNPVDGTSEATKGSDTTAQLDDLGITKYIDGISRFIDNCTTPMTIAFQGNRGGEENSVLRILFNRLGEQSKSHRLWFNVRQFSQGESGEALSILVGKKLMELFSDGDNTARKGGDFIANLAGLVTGSVAGDSSIGKEMVSGLLNRYSADSSEQLVELFAQKVAALGITEKVILFIDGLDRFMPTRAVELLEAMRGFFVCKACVFVIATDYDTICSGIQEFYGQGVDENRGKSFFDELFKMSFRVPAARYNVEKYVKGKLESLDIQTGDETELDLYVSLIHNSVGKDLEDINRLFTSFQLIKNMADEEMYKRRYNRLVLFALLCMQTVFREIYDYAIQNRDNVTPGFLAGLCGYSSQPWGVDLVSDDEKAAFQNFGNVFAHIINQDGDKVISEAECRAFADILEFSSITSK